GRARNSHARRRALPPRQLAMGAERRVEGFSRLETGARISQIPLGGLQRSALALRAGTGIADAPAARRKLQGLDQDLSLEEALRNRVSLRRTALHPPTLARLDRLSRHSG